MKRLTALGGPAALALVLGSGAAAHGGGTAVTGYRSTISDVKPSVPGLLPAVLGGDDRLRVVNYSGKTIVVSGYDGEPFLRFTKAGVYENTRSPSTYLSRERNPANASVPTSADSSAPPTWRRIAAAAESVVWHDHRIHWVRPNPPRVVEQAPEEIHLIFRWRVPATADGQPFAISGFLGYAPPLVQQQEAANDGSSPWLLAAIVAISLLVAAALVLGARHARRRAPT